MENKPKLRIGLTGNIGAGKTSIMLYLKQNQCHFSLVDEPLQAFNSFATVSGMNIKPLQMFYENPFTEAGFFQIHACDSFENIFKSYQTKNVENVIEVWDRLPHEIDIFTNTLFKLKQIPPFGYEYCKKKLHDILSKYQFHVDHIYYVQTNPKDCYDRVQLRKRSMEVNYELLQNQIEHLHLEYEKYMVQNKNLLPCDVTVSEANDVKGRGEECMKLIKSLLNSR